MNIDPGIFLQLQDRRSVRPHSGLALQIQSDPLFRFVRTHLRKCRLVFEKGLFNLAGRNLDAPLSPSPFEFLDRNAATPGFILKKDSHNMILKRGFPQRIDLLFERPKLSKNRTVDFLLGNLPVVYRGKQRLARLCTGDGRGVDADQDDQQPMKGRKEVS
ncbi:MAG TPA: hypothetical protein PKM58_03335 [Pyrinomonadaceae bacterium]|nr:hypothetical protein [Pyrinomonadaceae bacterium]